jgi:SAM-dependent methyltransferase
MQMGAQGEKELRQNTILRKLATMDILRKTKIYQSVRKAYKKLAFTKRNAILDQQMNTLGVPLSEKQLEVCRAFSNRKSMVAAFPKDAVIAEVGVAAGDFSADILEVARPRKFFLIDAWHMDERTDYGEAGFAKVNARFKNEINKGTVVIKRGFSHEKLNEFEDDYFDWVYIDAAHDYLSVKKDLEIAFRKVKNGGIVAGHDYLRWGDRGIRFGVLEAVNNFCVQMELPFTGISLDNDNNWSYALKVTK